MEPFKAIRIMNIDRWLERIYNEKDIGRSIATTVAGVAGLASYLYGKDWVVAAFITLIVFPLVRILASAIHSYLIRSRKHSETRDQVKDLFENLGREERAAVEAFVYSGGSVITWTQANNSPYVSVVGIESLIHRELIHQSVTADGFSETFTLDSRLFDYANKVLHDVW